MTKNRNTYPEFRSDLSSFAAELTKSYGQKTAFSPEDQLKAPVVELLKNAGQKLDLNVHAVTEVQASEVGGRPDIGVTVKTLLMGYIELKSPGKGANPGKFKQKGDKEQWKKFTNLPNLIYTDGNEWALYRNGERIGSIVKMEGDVTIDKEKAINDENSKRLFHLIRDFLFWKPIVPSTPKALAELIAPLCRYLRSDVLEALENPESNLSILADDWRKYLFPDADNKQFADAYAQTLTYALLLARLTGVEHLTISDAVKTIRTGHRLLSETLKILGDEKAKQDISVPVDLLERVISAVDPELMSKKDQEDLWLYFYEDFLAAYDPKMRKDRGVYFTPVEVVKFQIRLVAELLSKKFKADYSFVDEKVITLDPAAGTGTYILAALQHGLEEVTKIKGKGMRASAATRAANNLHAFEILVGPYSVAHLRMSQSILSEGGSIPKNGVHVYLSDTLESPNETPPQLPLLYQELGEEHKRALKVKTKTPVLVCIGNPPYDRQHRTDEETKTTKRKGGWVRFGEEGEDESSIFQSFTKPLTDEGLGVHAKNLYNDYVYFWRWALWKVFEHKEGQGIVSFITASSYLHGPGFAGMRKVMREIFDELWIVDLEGDNKGARKSENVFAIQTPVAIAIGVRYETPVPETPANTYYVRISGSRSDKLKKLDEINSFSDVQWNKCLSGWVDPLLPTGESDYWSWPLLTEVFPWQISGMQYKRSWPLAETEDVLLNRWELFLLSEDRKLFFKESRDRKIHKNYVDIYNPESSLSSLLSLSKNENPPEIKKIAFRSFDHQWAFVDSRLGDYLRPSLHRAHSNNQIYLTSLLTDVLGIGPAAVATCHIPDLHHFCNRGAKDVIPLYLDRNSTKINVTSGLLKALSEYYAYEVTGEFLFAYAYTILASANYVSMFWDELTIPGPRLPISKDSKLFMRGVDIGKALFHLHTFGERFVPKGKKRGRVTPGKAKCKVGTPTSSKDYPEEYEYNLESQELRVGKGVFENVRPEIWEFSVSGLEVLKSWLGYRMKTRSGRKSSPLDDIRPASWVFDDELLELLWVLDGTVDMMPKVNNFLSQVLASKLFNADELPSPSDDERKGPDVKRLTKNNILPGMDI